MKRRTPLYSITKHEIKNVLQGYTRGKAPPGLRQDDGWSFSCSPLIKHQKPSTVNSSQKKTPQKPESIFCDSERKTVIDSLCKAMFNCTEAEGYFESLDAKFSELVECSIDTTEPDEVVVERAYGILIRLPKRALEIDMSEVSLSQHWEDLSVVSKMSTNTIRLAIAMACDVWWGGLPAPVRLQGMGSYVPDPDDWFAEGFNGFLDTVVELFHSASEFLDGCKDSKGRKVWFLVKVFLWSSWQRCVMLVFWYILDHQLTCGFAYDRNEYLGLKTPLFGQQALEDYIQQNDETTKSKYMCNWAYRALKMDRNAIAQDFRRFHERFADLFGERPARCFSTNYLEPCCGISPKDCQRFVGAVIKNQSAHDTTCSKRCHKLFWDERSYHSIQGARAVSMRETDQSHLRYSTASESTLAISHVWSHGQGGRPERNPAEGDESGFNSCLHRRYVDIAKRLGCDSYWMDTPCIPADHQLRREAITNINSVFRNSKATLVCDRDVMEIDISSLESPEKDRTDFNIRLQESILATVLVCDWNVRSWTLLEAMRGRQKIILLCKDSATISVKRILKNVSDFGSIDIATMCLTSQHLLPAVVHRNMEVQNFPARDALESVSMGFVSLPEAACLLNHRHASRKQDDVVIWSLLVQEQPSYDAEEMWLGKFGTRSAYVRTGFLISNAPRIIGVKGLGWAPRSPVLHLEPAECSAGTNLYPSYAGHFSESAEMTHDGLIGQWGIYRCESGSNEMEYVRTALVQSTVEQVHELSSGLLLQPLAWGTYFSNQKPVASIYRGSNGHLFGFCTLVQVHGSVWRWRGVVEWGKRHPVPNFEVAEVLLE